jgi:hypothetical protein
MTAAGEASMIPTESPKLGDVILANGQRASVEAVKMRSRILEAVDDMLQDVMGRGQEANLRINTDGCPMIRGTDGGASTLYCGRTLGIDAIPGSDGRCGPNDGSQCPSCELAQKLGSEPSFGTFSYASRELRLRDAAETLKSLIMGNRDINARNHAGDTALLIAAKKGEEQVLLTLLAAKADIDSDKDGKTALEVTEHEKCQNILKWIGADGWTPLMINAECNASNVMDYLRLREALLSIRDRQPSPDWLESSVRKFEFLVDADWTWGPCERSSMTISQNKLNIRKTNQSPDYSGAMGSAPFDGGFHMWAVQVDNVQSMWLGIARGIETDGLDSSPGENGEYMLAFPSSGGHLVTRGQDATLDFQEQPTSSDGDSEECSKSASFPGYSSGQIVQFELDTTEHRLHVRIDGSLVVTVHDVDDKDVRPYLCMDYFESATVLARSKQVPSGAALAPQDRRLAFENSAWSSEVDLALSGLSIKGVASYFWVNNMFVDLP